MEFLAPIHLLSLVLLLAGIGLAFSEIRLSGWTLGWILLSGALLLQGFRSILSYLFKHGGVDAATYSVANDWMGLGFSLLVVAAMYMMREVFAKHRLAEYELRAITAAAQDAIIMMDNTGRITYWNDAAQRIFGYSAQEAQGKNLHELIVPERYRTDFEKGFDAFSSTGESPVIGKTLELSGLRKDGTEIVTEQSISGVNVDGKWHAIFIVRDLTERKQVEARLRESEEHFKSLANMSSDWFWEQDADLRFTRIIGNDRLRGGLPAEEYIGKTRWEIPYAGLTEEQVRQHNALLEARQSFRDFEFQRPAPDGSLRYRSSSGEPVYDSHGNFKGYRGFGRDITERKQVEETLRETKEHLETRIQERTAELERTNRALQAQIAERKAAEEAVKHERQRLYDVLETLPVYVVLLTADHRVLFANRFFRGRFGESEGRRCYEYLFHRDAPCEICETYTVLKTAAPHQWEWTGPDGRNYDIFDFPFTDKDGAALILEMGIDITERKHSEEALQKAHDELERRVAERTRELTRANEGLRTEIIGRKRAEKEIQDLSKFPSENPSPVLRIARDGTLLYINEAGRSLLPLWHLQVGQASPPVLREPVFQSMDNGSTQVLDLEHGERVYSFFVAPIVASGYTNLYGRDITERKRAEVALRESERKLRLIAENATDVIFAYDMDRRLIYVNPALEEFTGYTVAELRERNFINWLHPEDEAKIKALWEALFAGKGFSGEEFRIVTKDGQIKWCLSSWGSLYDESGRQIGVQGRERDITERKRVQETRDQLAAIVENSNDAIFSRTLDGTIVSWNAGAEKMLGYAATEAIGKPITFTLPPGQQSNMARHNEQILRGEVTAPHESRRLTKDERVIDTLSNHSPIRDSAGKIIGASLILHDISERKNQEQKIARLSRIHAVLGGINSLIVRVHDRQELFDEACRIVVEHGGFRMAWISEFDAVTLDTTPIAWAGIGATEYAKTKTTARADVPLGQGVAGRAIREKTPVFCNDIAAEPNVGGAMRKEAIRRGYRSFIALPLFVEGVVMGTLTLCAKEPNFFTADEVELLTGLAGDISFALDNFEREAQRKRAEEALHDYARRLQSMARRLIAVEETERRNINRELHDRVGANLSALNLNLSILRSQLPQESLHAVGARLRDTQSLLEDTTTHVRNLMADLHPPALDDYGLLVALRTYAESLGARLAVPISVHGENFVPRLPLAAETALFRVAQGALANAVTHARAKRIQVMLAATPDRATLTIADDGAGFDVARAALAHASWGLPIMRERAEAVSARLTVESTPGKGTRVCVEISREKR